MIHVNNKTNLPLKIIGEVYDKYTSFLSGDTLYENKIDIEIFTYKKKEYKMEIQYKVSCVSIIIEELDIEVKKISTKGMRFPTLPK